MPLLEDPGLAAAARLPALIPLAWAAISDLRRMEIPDAVHFALIGLFVLWAPLFLAPEAALIHLAHGAVALAAGLALALLAGMGGGDMKLLGASALMIAPAERAPVLFLLCAFMVALVAVVGPARWALKRAGKAPAWQSLKAEEGQYPLGVSIALAVGAVLAAPVALG